jgi:DNA-binding response OmpR family regulator
MARSSSGPGAGNGVVRRTRFIGVVIDSDGRRCSLYREILATLGIETIVAHTAALGVEMCIEHRPDLLVVNMTLPDADAFYVLSRVHGLGYPLPGIVVSEPLFDTTVRTRAMELGVTNFAFMPFRRREFSLIVQAALPHLPARARTNEIPIGDITFNFNLGKARRGRRSVDLSPEERRLAHILAMHVGEMVSSDDCGRYVLDDWDKRPVGVRPSALRLVKHRLTKRLTEIGAQWILETVRAKANGSGSRAQTEGGYRFVNRS